MDSYGLQKETLTVSEAAKMCGVNRVTMWRWVKANDLPATTTMGGHHRIRQSDISAFIKGSRRAGGRSSAETRILIVDDDVQIQKLMHRTLEKEGFSVKTCSNGFEAGICVMRFKPHLIILDLFMPYMDGFQVCRQLKSDPDTAAIKIIAISGRSTQTDVEKVKHCGADLFLKKPLGKAQLIRQVELLINPRDRIESLHG